MADITAILNLHDEGLLAGPSIHSFEAAIAYAVAQQLAVESIVVIDRADETTKAVFENLQSRHKLLVVDAGDPSLARNMGVAAANGAYIAFLDGDDLWGYRWLAVAHGFCVRSPIEVIAHSEVNIIFGEESLIWWHADSEDSEFDLDFLRIGNYWDALSFARREIFIKYPFKKNDMASGFGIEDWHWNCVTFENGIAHRPVPNTVHMKRRRYSSQTFRGMAHDLVISPTELSLYRWKPMPRQRPASAEDVGSVGLCVPGLNETSDIQPLKSPTNSTQQRNCSQVWRQGQTTGTMKPKLDLSMTISWSHHRSGWGYCMESLRPLHAPGGVLLVDCFEDRVWTNNPVTRPWIGFLHAVPNHPRFVSTVYGYESDTPLASIVTSDTWAVSEPYCLGIFVLSSYVQRFLSPLTEVPVEVLYHATEFVAHTFDHERFLRNTDKKLILVGHWQRDFQCIFDLQVNRYQKWILKCEPAVNYERILATVRPNDSVKLRPYASPDQYDILLGENVVFLPLFDSSANNALIECIARNTPVLVNKLPAVVEHLGEHYPLYYETLEEAARKVEDFDLVSEASAYLQAMNKERFSREYFVRSFRQSPICRKLDQILWLGRIVGIPRARRWVHQRR
jgi:hypothetical protein